MNSQLAKLAAVSLACAVFVSACGFNTTSEKECYEATRATLEAIERHNRAIDSNKDPTERDAGGDAIGAALKWKNKACK